MCTIHMRGVIVATCQMGINLVLYLEKSLYHQMGPESGKSGIWKSLYYLGSQNFSGIKFLKRYFSHSSGTVYSILDQLT